MPSKPIMPRPRAFAILLTTLALSMPAALAMPFPTDDRSLSDPWSAIRERKVLQTYARDTWRSLEAMTHPVTGLPADWIDDDRTLAGYTSPTNIAAYLWSVLVARDLRIVGEDDARRRIGRALETLAAMERHGPSGQFYNWYDPATGERLEVWPGTESRAVPFLSSVDNAWLAAALLMVARAMPEQGARTRSILDAMDFSCYYDANARGPDLGAGLMRGGFWTLDEAPADAAHANYCGKGPDVVYTGHHYGTLNSETRIVSYVAIALGQVPREHYFALWRTFPAACDWGWDEMSPTGETRTYLGIEVYEGSYTYRGRRLVPSWGGSMFEALMPNLLVPESHWGARSWGLNHPLYVLSQIEHGMDEAKYGYWGFSPARNPDGEGGDYREWGVDPLGMDPGGYTTDQERTTVDHGFRDPSGAGFCPGREPQPLPASYGSGVVAPHASFLALEFARSEALENLDRLRWDFGAYGWGGFFDAVDVTNGQVAHSYLALDQGMIMAALGNALQPDRLRGYFTRGAVESSLRPLLTVERFTAGLDESNPDWRSWSWPGEWFVWGKWR